MNMNINMNMDLPSSLSLTTHSRYTEEPQRSPRLSDWLAAYNSSTAKLHYSKQAVTGLTEVGVWRVVRTSGAYLAYLDARREKHEGAEEEAGVAIKNPSTMEPRSNTTTANEVTSLFASMIWPPSAPASSSLSCLFSFVWFAAAFCVNQMTAQSDSTPL